MKKEHIKKILEEDCANVENRLGRKPGYCFMSNREEAIRFALKRAEAVLSEPTISKEEIRGRKQGVVLGMIWGTLLGFFIGLLLWLFRAPEAFRAWLWVH